MQITSEGVLIVEAVADRLDSESWFAEGEQGLFGIGDDFGAARRALASAVLDAHEAGQIKTKVPVSGVRVLCRTRKTFLVESLKEGS